ncbi:MAG: PIN domain nuclease [Actinomycetota bacterium]
MTIYLIDASAWHRAQRIADEWAERLQAGSLAICNPSRLEILFSARSAHDYGELLIELLALRQVPCKDEQFDRAIEVQQLLAQQGGVHHRSVKIPDLLVAASAEAAGAIVWHYDEDFDRIAAVTGQPTEWIAPRGSL